METILHAINLKILHESQAEWQKSTDFPFKLPRNFLIKSREWVLLEGSPHYAFMSFQNSTTKCIFLSVSKNIEIAWVIRNGTNFLVLIRKFKVGLKYLNIIKAEADGLIYKVDRNALSLTHENLDMKSFCI